MAKKIFCSVMSFILCAIIAFVACFFAVPDFNTWVKDKISGIKSDGDISDNDNNDDTDIKGDEVDNGNVVVTVNTASAYMRLAATPVATSVDEDSYTLTATISPAEATYKDVDWQVAWKNSSSTWANGKTVTDYCTLTPTSDGALTATLTCKQAFGEQIIVTVTSRDDETKSASCTADYKKRLLGVTTSLTNTAGSGGTLSPDNVSTLKVYVASSTSTDYKLNVVLNETAGTISNDYSYAFFLHGSAKLSELVKQKGAIYGSTPTVYTATNGHYAFYRFASNTELTKAFTKAFLLSNIIYMDLDWYEDDYTPACNAVITNLSGWTSYALLAPTLYLTYGGQEYTYTYTAKLDVSAIKVAVSNVAISGGNIVF